MRRSSRCALPKQRMRGAFLPPPRSEVLICIAPPLSGLGGWSRFKADDVTRALPRPPHRPFGVNDPETALDGGGGGQRRGFWEGNAPTPLRPTPNPPPKRKPSYRTALWDPPHMEPPPHVGPPPTSIGLDMGTPPQYGTPPLKREAKPPPYVTPPVPIGDPPPPPHL